MKKQENLIHTQREGNQSTEINPKNLNNLTYQTARNLSKTRKTKSQGIRSKY